MAVERTYNEIRDFIAHRERDASARANERELLELYHAMWTRAETTQKAIDGAKDEKAKLDVLEKVQHEIAGICPHRGGSLFDWALARFTGGDLQPHVAKYMKMAMRDLDAKWVQLEREAVPVKLLFVQARLNIDKHYPNAAGIEDVQLLFDVPSAIAAWVDPDQLKTSDVIREWLKTVPKDSIWTGQQGSANPVSKQLGSYRQQQPGERYAMWSALVHYIRQKKNMDPVVLEEHIRVHVPQIVEMIRPHTGEASARLMEDFLEGWLDNIVAGDPWDWAKEE